MKNSRSLSSLSSTACQRPKVGEPGAQIDRDVEDAAAQAADQLGLGLGARWKCSPRTVPRRAVTLD